MCINVQPICNACGAVSRPIELHECIFRDCNPEYIERRKRFLTRFELRDWDCDNPDCGLNMRTIDANLDEIHQMLRMQVNVLAGPVQGQSGAGTNTNDSAAGQDLPGFDGNGTSSSHPNIGATGLLALPADSASTATPLSVTVPAVMVDIPPRPQSAPTPDSTFHNNASHDKSSTSNGNIASGDRHEATGGPATGGNVTTNDNVAANDNSTTNNEVAVDSSIQTGFDPESVDLDAFPKCKNCFRDRRRCNGEVPCDKCQQRGCSRSCRPVTLELLRKYPARAERILERAGRNGASG